jgi:hypothetical protein
MSEGRERRKGYRLFLVATFAIFVAAALIWWLARGEASGEEAKPMVAYSSSIPLAFGEADIGAVVRGAGSADPFFLRLSERYVMEPINDLERLPDVAPAALLLVQPRALSPAENVALDRWVRSGGEMLLLTDPALTRESGYPLGDKRRPLFTSLASPLLSHWGLELVLPMDEPEERVERSVDDWSFETHAPGAFRKLPSGDANCALSGRGLIAECEVGEGRAVLIADADLIDPALWEAEGWFGRSDGAIRLIEHYLADMAATTPR